MNFVTLANGEAILPELEVKGGAPHSAPNGDGARCTSTQPKARQVSHDR